MLSSFKNIPPRRSDKDPRLFLEEVQKITQVMHISEEHSVELAAYRLKELAYD